MKNNRKYIKLSLSTLLLGLLLFLSCDDRNPVSAQTDTIIYDMQIQVENSEENITHPSCAENDSECESSTAYAAYNTYDELEITLNFNALNESSITEVAGKVINFSYQKIDYQLDGDGESTEVISPTNGYIQFCSGNDEDQGNFCDNVTYDYLDGITGEAQKSSAQTDSGGWVRGYWKDNGDIGTIRITAQLLNDSNEPLASATSLINLDSVDHLATSIVADTSNPSGTSIVADNVLPISNSGEQLTQNIQATVYRYAGENSTPPLPNVLVEFELLGAVDSDGNELPIVGSLDETTAVSDINGVASVPYRILDNEDLENMTLNFIARVPGGAEGCFDSCENQIDLELSSDAATEFIFESQLDKLDVNYDTNSIINDNSSIDYQTLITVMVIDEANAIVKDPMEINFRIERIAYADLYACYGEGLDGGIFSYPIDGPYTNSTCDNGCSVDEECLNLEAEGGAYLSNSSAMTDSSSGQAQSMFSLNSENFLFSDENGQNIIVDFEVHLSSDSTFNKQNTKSYFVQGSQYPERDVAEFFFYDVSNSNVLPYDIVYNSQNSESLEVIPEVLVKNSDGVGVSNVLVRFELLHEKTTSENGFCQNGNECIDDGDCLVGNCISDGYCDDGSSCTLGDVCSDGSDCAYGAYGELDAGFIYTCCCDNSRNDQEDNDNDGEIDELDECEVNCCGASATYSYGSIPFDLGNTNVTNVDPGFVGVSYSSNKEGIDKLRAYILDPEDANIVLHEDILIINASATEDVNPVVNVDDMFFESDIIADVYDGFNEGLGSDGIFDASYSDPSIEATVYFTAKVVNAGGSGLGDVEVEFERDSDNSTAGFNVSIDTLIEDGITSSINEEASGQDLNGSGQLERVGEAIASMSFFPYQLDGDVTDVCINAKVVDPATGDPIDFGNDDSALRTVCVQFIKQGHILSLQVGDFSLDSNVQDADLNQDGLSDLTALSDESNKEVLFEAQVLDQQGSGIASVPIEFKNLLEWGNLTSEYELTNDAGIASVILVLGPDQINGLDDYDYITNHLVEASIPDLLNDGNVVIGASNGKWDEGESFTDSNDDGQYVQEDDEFDIDNDDIGSAAIRSKSIQLLKEEYVKVLEVAGMNLSANQIINDINFNGIKDYTLSGTEDITLSFEVETSNAEGGIVSGVPISFQSPSDISISSTLVTTAIDGKATVSISVNKADISTNPTSFSITASIYDPTTGNIVDFQDGSQASQSLSVEFFTEEYVQSLDDAEILLNVADFDFVSTLTDDYDGNGVLDLIIIDESTDDASEEDESSEESDSSGQEVTFTAIATNNLGGKMTNVPVQFETLSEFGSLSSDNVLTDENGEASTILTINPGLLTSAVTSFSVEARIMDNNTGNPLLLISESDDASNCNYDSENDAEYCNYAVGTLSAEFFTQEYVQVLKVAGFAFSSNLTDDIDNDDILDLTLLGSESQDSGNDSDDEGEDGDTGDDLGDDNSDDPGANEYTVTFTATVTDLDGAFLNDVPVEFVKTSDFGFITVGTALTENGQASTAITLDEFDIGSTGFADFSVQAKVLDPVTNAPKDLGDGDSALRSLNTEFFTEQYAIFQNIAGLQVSESTTETIEDNSSITYETTITARTVDIYGGLVTDPVMINFQKAYFCSDGSACNPNGNECPSECSTTQGGYLTETSVMTNAQGFAETTFIVNSQDYESTAVLAYNFTISLANSFNQDSISEALNLSYFVQGNQEPELDVSEFHFYPDIDTISHSLNTQTNISVIAKNNAGVGLSNVLVRFSLLQVRDSNGELSSGQEYTCCDSSTSDGDTGGGAGGSFSCADGSACDPAGDPCEDGSACAESVAAGLQNGIAQVTYTNIEEGIDRIYAYILDPSNPSNILWDDILFINSIPSCPDCAEQLILTSEEYILPNDSDQESTNIYAFYTDSNGNLAPVNDIISFSAQQPNDDGDWIDIGSINPQSAFFQDGAVDLNYIPDEFDFAINSYLCGDGSSCDNEGESCDDGSTCAQDNSLIHASSTFNMENSSDIAYIIGSYKGLSDTLGIQINSTEASFVEIVPPFPSEIIVQGGGGLESTLLTTEIRDGNGNLVNNPYTVTFEITEPQLDNVHLNGVPGSVSAVETSSNGTASVTLNAGTKPGTVHMRVTVADCCDGDDGFDSDFELIAEATPVTITTGPPTSAVIGYAFGEAANIGGGLTEMPISIMLWDAWSNPVSDSTAVYFGLTPSTSAAVIAQAKTGNEKPDVGGAGGGGTWPGVAWTTTQYNSAQLFEFPEIVATTTGNVCLNTTDAFNTEATCEAADMVWLPIYDDGGTETSGLCSMPTGTNPQECDPQDYSCAEIGNPFNCDTEAAAGFGTDPDLDGIYWGIALPLKFSSLDNLVSYENVCVDCTLNLVPIGNTQYDFQDPNPISPLNTFSADFRAQLLDSYNVPVEGALVELIINGSQGGPIRQGGGCATDANGDGEADLDGGGNITPLIDPDTGLPYIGQQICEDAGGVWGLGNWIDEFDVYGATALQTDRDGLKYFSVTFNGDECILTNDDPNNEQWECTSPTIQANLLNPNGATSEAITIELNNTIP
ncbi:MAG: hypothetical protein CMG13_03935 [Candidatus Marinimicrobia bacterium]|nr:hypothetical protein [Candidatus Neomarinimicrobiota bacterium]